MRPHLPMLGSGVSALAACLLLSSCAIFESSRKMDMAPFSQNAVTMYAEVAKISIPFQFRELRRYLDEPVLLKAQETALPVLLGWRGLVSYSNQLVALNNARLSESEKNRRLAEYLLEASRRVMDRPMLQIYSSQFGGLDTVLGNIRSADTFLDGIEAASPLVDAIVYAMNTQIDTVASYVPTIVAAFQNRIETDQLQQKRNLIDLRNLQARYHHAQVLLYRATWGETGALDSLLQVDPSLKEFLNAGGKTSGKEWRDAEETLTAKLDRIYTSMQQLMIEAQSYKARQNEVQEWREEISVKIKIARDGLMVWAQSHHNLGKGVPVPPLIDVMGMAGGLAKKVVPVP